MSRYQRPCRVVFHNGSEPKRDFIPLLKDFDIKHVCTTVGNPQANGPLEQVHQVIHNMIVTKYIKTRTVDYINTWGEILTSVSWAIRALHHSKLYALPNQLIFGRKMIFNLISVIYLRVIHAREQKKSISIKYMRK